jgi:Fe-S cluster assembly protein SufD
MPASQMQLNREPDMSPDLSQIAVSGAVRNAALVQWQEQGWPGPRAESWRFTKLDALAAHSFQPANALASIPAGEGAEMAAAMDAHAIRLVNGVLDATSLDGLPSGVRVGNLLDDQSAQDALRALAPANHPVSNLSLAVMTAGLVFDVDGVIERPLMLVFEGDDDTLSAHPVMLFRLAPAAQMVMAEWYQSSVSLSAPLIGIDIGANGRFDFAKIQAESKTTSHIAATGVNIGEGATLAGFSLSVGGKLARLETHVKMAGENGHCQLSAIYLGRERQHHDVTTMLEHAVPNCTSDQIIRGVLDDRSRGVYQGKVRVAPDAQKTDGQQMSRALLLSRKAEADAKPELEIYADDVVCSHGATVGELDQTQLFYLTSRGIPEAKARAMLIEAFLVDTIETVENPGLANLLNKVAQTWMVQAGLSGGQEDFMDDEAGDE